MPLISSQHFPAWVALQMSVYVSLCDLASARQVQLSVRMSAVVSMSINQSSSFEESCPLNVGISCSTAVVRLASLFVAHKVSVYACIVLCTGSSLGGEAECSWSNIVRCCRLSVNCVSSAIGVDWWVVDFKLAYWSLSYQNCSSSLAKGQWVSVSSLYSSDDLLYLLGIVCSTGTRSRAVSWLSYLVIMVWVLWYIPKMLAKPLGVLVCGLRTCACWSGGTGYMRWKSLIRWWLCWSFLGWSSSV